MKLSYIDLHINVRLTVQDEPELDQEVLLKELDKSLNGTDEGRACLQTELISRSLSELVSSAVRWSIIKREMENNTEGTMVDNDYGGQTNKGVVDAENLTRKLSITTGPEDYIVQIHRPAPVKINIIKEGPTWSHPVTWQAVDMDGKLIVMRTTSSRYDSEVWARENGFYIQR